MKALTTLLVVGMFATTVAIADDVDDVKAAVQGLFAAVNAGMRMAGSHAAWQNSATLAVGVDFLTHPTLPKNEGKLSKPQLLLVSSAIISFETWK